MFRSASVCAFVLVSSVSSAHAGFISVLSHERDGDIRNNGVSHTTATFELAVGRAGGLVGEPVPDNSTIMFFQLPSLALGQSILSATLDVTLTEAASLLADEHVDLYGLGYVTTLPPADDIPDSWYFSAGLDTRTGNDLGTNIGSNSIVRLAEAFAISSTPLGHLNTDGPADTLLVNFINDLYTLHGAQGGDYLTLRMNANKFFEPTPAGGVYRRYLFASRDYPFDDGAWPVLTLQTPDVPEPSSMILFGLTAAGAFGLRVRPRRARSTRLHGRGPSRPV